MEGVRANFTLHIMAFARGGRNVAYFCKNNGQYFINQTQKTDTFYHYRDILSSQMKLVLDGTRFISDPSKWKKTKKKKDKIDDHWSMHSNADSIFFDKYGGEDNRLILRYNFRTVFRRDSTIANTVMDIYVKRKKSNSWDYTFHQSVTYDEGGRQIPLSIYAIGHYMDEEKPDQWLCVNCVLSKEKCGDILPNSPARLETNFERFRSMTQFVPDDYRLSE